MELVDISFEQAKSLKDLGFPQDYDELDLNHYYTNLDGGKYRKEAQELVINWIEETKQIYVYTTPDFSNKTGELTGYTVRIVTGCDVKNGCSGYFRSGFKKKTEALSAGIDKVIEILKNE